MAQNRTPYFITRDADVYRYPLAGLAFATVAVGDPICPIERLGGRDAPELDGTIGSLSHGVSLPRGRRDRIAR